MTPYPPAELSAVFGPSSQGLTPADRASTSDRIFVRSQSQLSPARDKATGLTMSAAFALELVGYEGLREAVDVGAVVVSESLDEPARTLKEQRERLEVSIEQVARAAGLSSVEVQNAEQRGTITPIRKLRRLAQTLGLDDDRIGAVPSAEADQDLAVRLRTLRKRGQQIHLSATLVLKLAEAAWTITRERKLAGLLGIKPSILSSFEADDDYGRYGKPPWQKGYELAAETRRRLNIDPVSSIRSVRTVIEEIGIPLIQEEMGQTFAGATIENRGERGLVVNTEGGNRNVWVRRVTLCHELAHLLWDPGTRLHRLHVDRYDELTGPNNAPIEARANAFSIAFLAPPEAVLQIVKLDASVAQKVSEVMSRFGIAATAAKYHVANVARLWGAQIDTTRVRSSLLPAPEEDWEVSESWTVDYFPVPGVPVSRRGRFAGLVANAMRKGILTLDMGASNLDVPSDELERRIDVIFELCGRN
jgi:transcriptional regulator with XRE-family HTH domain